MRQSSNGLARRHPPVATRVENESVVTLVREVELTSEGVKQLKTQGLTTNHDVSYASCLMAVVMHDERRYDEAAAKTDIVGNDRGEGTNSYGLSTGG